MRRLLPYVILPMLVVLAGFISIVDLQNQGKNPNFSAMPGTYPATTGTTLPATCGVGQMYFKTNAPAGSNIYLCTSTNIWNPIAVTPLAFSMTISGNTEILGASCTTNTPCIVDNGAGSIFILTSSVSCAVSGNVTSGTVF